MANAENVALEQLSKEVRAAYFMEAQLYRVRTTGAARGFTPTPRVVAQWDGGTDSRGVTYKAVWPKIVKLALGCGLSPTLLVKASFRLATGNRGPLPQMMLSAQAVDNAKLYKTIHAENIKQTMIAFQAEAKQSFLLKGMSRKDASDTDIWRDVICDPVLTSGPLFRFGLACDLGQVDLATALWFNAKLEYVQSPDEYDAVIQQYLPTRFREEARQYVRSLLRR